MSLAYSLLFFITKTSFYNAINVSLSLFCRVGSVVFFSKVELRFN